MRGEPLTTWLCAGRHDLAAQPIACRRSALVRALAATFAVLALATAARVAAQPDPLQLARADARPAAVRWDNLERAGDPLWVAGPSPERLRGNRLHWVRFGDEVAVGVRLPSTRMLRIRTADALSVWRSDGSGLYVEAVPQRRVGGDAVYGPYDRATVLRIEGSGGARAALFISRLVETSPGAATGVPVAATAGEALRVHQHDSGRQRIFYLAATAAPVRFSGIAAGRYRLEARALAPSARRGTTRSVTVTAAAETLARFEVATAPSRRERVDIDGVPGVPGRLEHAWIEIPATAAAIEVIATGPTLVRLVREDDARIMPVLNPAPAPRWAAPWDASDQHRMLAAVLGGERPLSAAAVEPVAHALAGDNRHAEGPLAALALARAASDARPDAGTLARLSAEIRERYTERQPAAAVGPRVSAGRHRYHAARARDDNREADVVIDRAALTELTRSLPQADFDWLHAGTPGRYRIPPRRFDTELEIVVLAPAAAGAVELTVGFDDGSTRALRLARETLPPEHRVLTLAEAIGAVTATAIADAATARLVLRKEVRVLSLSTVDGAPDLAVAVLWRRPLDSRLSDDDRLALRADLGPAGARSLLRDALHNVDALLDPGHADGVAYWQRLDDDPARRRLVQDLVPLLRTLRQRREDFRAGVPALPASDPALDPSRQTAAMAATRAALAAGDDLAALEHARAASRGPDPVLGATAHNRVVDILEAAAEDYLAEAYLRQLVLHGATAALRERAAERLAARYRAESAWLALEQLLVTRLFARPDAASGAALVDWWLASGRLDEALDLVTLLPAAEPERAAALAAAARAVGRRTVAAGGGGEPAPLRCGEGGAEPTVWRDADHALLGDAGRADIGLPGRGVSMTLSRLTPGAPARWRLRGPARVRLDLRLLHPGDATTPRDATIDVRVDDDTHAAPIPGDLPAPGLEPLDGAAPGRLNRYELTLSDGVHDLEIASAADPALAQVFVEQRACEPTSVSAPLPVPEPAVTGGAVHCAALADSAVLRCRFVGAAPGPGLAATPVRDGSPAVPARLPAEPTLAQGETDAVTLRARRLWRAFAAAPDAAARAAPHDALLALAAAHPTDVLVQRLAGRAAASSTWHPLDYISESAGVRTLEAAWQAPLSRALRIRRALADPACADSIIVSGAREWRYRVFNLEARTIDFTLRRCDPLMLSGTPLALRLGIDGDGDEKSLVLDGAMPAVVQRVTLPAGDRQVVVRIEAPRLNQFLGIEIHDPRAVGPHTRTVEYHVATAEAPVSFDLAGPALLRVDELIGERTTSRYLEVEPGWQRLELAPSPAAAESLLRVYVRTPQERAEPSLPRPDRRPVPLEPTARFDVALMPHTPATRFTDTLPLGGQEDGTPSVATRFVSRKRVDDEDGGAGRLRESFATLEAVWREYLGRRHGFDDVFARAGAELRLREHGGPVGGGEIELSGRPWHQRQLRTGLRLAALVQAPGETAPGGDADTEWRLASAAWVSLYQPLTARIANAPRLTVFAQALSQQRNRDYRGRALDRDVFSRYKATHKQGWHLSDTLIWQPAADGEGYLRAALTSNEDFNPVRPDNLALTAGWRQLLGAGVVNARYLHQRFFDDEDRRRASNRRELLLDYEHAAWGFAGGVVQAGVRLNHNLSANDNSFLVTLRWHGNRGRGWRDFMPGEVRFDRLREAPDGHRDNVFRFD